MLQIPNRSRVEQKLRQLVAGNTSTSSDLDLNQGLIRTKAYRPAAVLLPVILRPTGAQVIFTKRSPHLPHHPGQVSLPGGKVDAKDASIFDTALREAEEEIGLNPSHVEIFGQTGVHHTATGFTITPVLGLIDQPFTARPQPSEVAEVFEVPLPHLLDLRNYRLEQRVWAGQKRQYYTVPWGPYYIWGATARILHKLAEQSK